MKMKSARQTIHRLNELCNRFGKSFSAEKLSLLCALPDLTVGTASDVRRLHRALCFIRAFPDSQEVHERAVSLLTDFQRIVDGLSESQRTRLNDSGITGTDIHYPYSFEVADWLAHRYPGLTTIDWCELDDSARLDELLEHLLEYSEADYFDSGQVSTEEWLGIALGNGHGTDFDWLMSQFRERQQHSRFWTSHYNAAEISLKCRLADSGLSKSANVVNPKSVFYRTGDMRSRVPNARKEITRPLDSVARLSRSEGARLIDVAMGSLAVRHRETIHFNYANPDDVYLADVGAGVNIAVTGLHAEHRYPLECTMGFLILSNGVPIGYGGSSMLFKQANTGINIFDEYRGSEAAWLWVQVMRVFHALTGCTRFIANGYQFGSENAEALKSGAFWFYYRLGYRPVDKDIRRLASNEFRKIREKRGHRTPVDTLKQLASCDMHLILAGARKSEFFDEDWIELCALLATRELAKTGRLSRKKSHEQLAHQLVADLGIESMKQWPKEERKWFIRLCPVVAATNPREWPVRDRKALIALIRAKGGETELDYAQLLNKHEPFFRALKTACRRVA